MPRAPCCDHKLGLKKGPWTRQEDQILIHYVQTYGHPNWRALPKQAGLLRCGKSCRLRWINYLRPDMKRGNFSPEEEDAIIHLHQTIGNRWSAIAARLPGRTDNEIKNVWHTHLKKRVVKSKSEPNQEEDTKPVKVSMISAEDSDVRSQSPSRSEYSSSITEIDDTLWTEDDTDTFDDGMDFWYNLLLQAEDELDFNLLSAKNIIFGCI